MAGMSIRHVLWMAICFVWLVGGCNANSERVVTFAVGGAAAELAFWEKLAQDFTQQTNIPVILLRQPSDTDQRRQGLVIPLEAQKSTPDVFLMDIAWIAQFAASGWLEPLGPIVTQSRFDLKAFFSNVLEQADHYHGHLIALPVYVDAGLLYYRTDLLEQAGIAGPPSTWDELIQYSLTIQERERRSHPQFWGFVWQGAQYEGLVCTFLEFAGSAGGGIRFESGEIQVDTPENRMAARLMAEFTQLHRISPPSTYTEMKEEEVRIAYQQGNALFERNWPYAWALHQSHESVVKGKTAIGPLPHFPGAKSVSTLGGWHIGMSKYSRHKMRSWKFIEYVLSYSVQKKLALGLGWNPGRIDLYGDSDVLSKMPHLARLRDIFTNAVPRPNIPYYAQLSEILQRHLNAVLAAKTTPEAALEAAQRESQRLLARYRDY